MNCLEFRHACLTEPDDQDNEFHAHAETCRACQVFFEEQQQMEARLRRALAVEPPAGLAARVMLKQSFAPRRWAPRLAVAATVLMAIAVTSVTYLWNRPLPIEVEVLAHIHAEPEVFAAPGPAATDKLAAVLRALGAQLDNLPGDVRYAGICDIRGRPGAHFVLAGERGPITVLLLPQERVPQRMTVGDANFEGVVLPAGSSGSLAIVGNRGEPLDALERRLRVHFRGNDV
jgi:hypothetical protein